MIKKEFINNLNKNVIQVLNENLELNFNVIKTLLRKGDIRINNKKIKENQMLQGGETITCFLPEFLPEIMYKDENILVVNKPKKYETISKNGKNDITEILRKQFLYCQPCHRLDINTSGVNVFALNEVAYNEITTAFKSNSIEKKYIALVSGKPEKQRILTHFLLKNSDESKVKIFDNKIKNSVQVITEYKLIKKINHDLSLLEITLHTGKTHQIRAHLAYNGLPILGDRKYGNSEINDKYKKFSQCLISYSIRFDFSPKSELYYLSNSIFKIDKDKSNLFDIGD